MLELGFPHAPKHEVRNQKSDPDEDEPLKEVDIAEEFEDEE